MPYVNLRVGARLSTEQREQLQREATELMHLVMRKKREVTVVQVDESDPQQWSVNGDSLNARQPIPVYVDIKVTAGTNSESEKSVMLAQTALMLKDVLGTVQEACYVVIDEVPGNAWGYDGHSQLARASSSAETEVSSRLA